MGAFDLRGEEGADATELKGSACGMAELSAEKLAHSAFDLSLLDERQLQEAWGHFGRRNVPGDEFLQFLLRREFLTNWQAERLIKGETSGFFCGDYKLLYLAGSGTFSRVYRAAHRETQDIVAVKLLRRRFSDEPSQVAQFVKEGKLGLKLRHPNIVPMYEVASHGHTHYMVMEFVEGQNLREFVKLRKKVEPLEATRMMSGIVAALAYAFERGVTHRDLKLTNVLVSSLAVPKLVDFGLAAKERHAGDAEAHNPRTVDYVGLEKACGVKRDDVRSDVFFAGCIYYHLLSGKPPLLETKDRAKRLARSRYTDVVPILKVEPELPKGIAAVIGRAMDINVTMRYQTPGELLADLQLNYRRLTEGHEVHEGTGHDAASLFAMWETPRQTQKVVLCVESNSTVQDTLRQKLKKYGYRVLMTRDPQWALDRFADNGQAADCVVFSTIELGDAALEAFQQFSGDEKTGQVPAILLLGEEHNGWAEQVEQTDHRKIITSPIRIGEFRRVLKELVPPSGQERQEEAVEE